MAAALTLTSRYDATGDGAVALELRSLGVALAQGFRLALTSQVQLSPTAASRARLVERLASYHELEPTPPMAVPTGGTWVVSALRLSHRPRHADDGPVRAFVIARDGTVHDVIVTPMERRPPELSASRPAIPPEKQTEPSDVAVVPHPVTARVAGNRRDPARARLVAATDIARQAWAGVAATGTRVTGSTPLDGAGAAGVEAVTVANLGDEEYRLVIDADTVCAEASTVAGFRHAFTTLAQLLAAGPPSTCTIEDAPRFGWRGLHVDLARQWFDPGDVSRIIDLAAWRKLNRVHLHLTDDEAWRLPVPGYPELTAIGGRRGHGLAIPPMLGSGPAPHGRGYTAGEIQRWVAQAGDVGVILVPEFDVPAHVHAALVALPQLRDADDTSRARSVQFFVDNVLVPGLPTTRAFLESVVDAVAELFSASPWIHIGGDEVPPDAWRGSPAVTKYRAARSLTSSRDVEAAFHRDLVMLIRERTGRSVGAWQEAAESGGVGPGEGYVVGWTSADASRKLAAMGFDVVMSPGEAYYLDMAVDDRWDTPGASWAGETSFDDVCAFEPGAGWSADELDRLIGVQACVWSEHVRDSDTFDRLVFPRLDAVAERGWTGRIAGGPSSLAARAAALPTLRPRR